MAGDQQAQIGVIVMGCRGWIELRKGPKRSSIKPLKLKPSYLIMHLPHTSPRDNPSASSYPGPQVHGWLDCAASSTKEDRWSKGACFVQVKSSFGARICLHGQARPLDVACHSLRMEAQMGVDLSHSITINVSVARASPQHFLSWN